MARLPVQERRQQLVDAAIRVMTRDGVAKATTRAISAEAEVSLSVFHYCFDSKPDLLEAVIKEITSHTVTPAKAAMTAGPTLRETVRTALGIYWQHVRDNPEEHLLTYELTQYALRRPGFEAVARAQYENYLAAYYEVLEQLRGAFEIEPRWSESAIATYMSSMTDGLTLHWLVLRNDEDAEAVLDGIAAQLAWVLGEPAN